MTLTVLNVLRKNEALFLSKNESRNDRHPPNESRNDHHPPNESHNDRHPPNESRNDRHPPNDHRSFCCFKGHTDTPSDCKV